MPGAQALAKASSMPVLPPGWPCMARKVRVGKNQPGRTDQVDLRWDVVRIWRRWFAGLRKECARCAFSLAIWFRLSDLALVTPARIAQTSSLSHRAIVQARVSSSGMSSCCAGLSGSGSRRRAAAKK
jgi:hypothetical protein